MFLKTIQTSTETVVPIDGPDGLKQYLRIDIDDDDGLLYGLAKAVEANIEQLTGRQLLEATYEFSLGRFPKSGIRLPRPPLLDVVSVKYLDENNVEQDYPAGAYTVLGKSDPVNRGVILWSAFDDVDHPNDIANSEDAIRVTFKAGYGKPADVPEPIKMAVRLGVSQYYDIRSDVMTGTIVPKVPRTSEMLLRSYVMEAWDNEH